jgi:hypothetical protein
MPPFHQRQRRSRVSICSTLPIVTAVAALSALPAIAHADVTLSDGVFANSTWAFELIGSGTSTVGQVLAGGNPGEFRRVDQTVVAGSGVYYGFSRYGTSTATRYDAVTQGAVISLDFSIQARFTGGPMGAPVNNTRLAMGVRQGTLTFVQSTFFSLTNPNWIMYSASGLTPADFFCANGSGTLNFSAVGGPMRFGFVTIDESTGGPAGSITDYDNFSTIVHNVPAPGAAALFGLGMLLAARRRR